VPCQDRAEEDGARRAEAPRKGMTRARTELEQTSCGTEKKEGEGAEERPEAADGEHILVWHCDSSWSSQKRRPTKRSCPIRVGAADPAFRK